MHFSLYTLSTLLLTFSAISTQAQYSVLGTDLIHPESVVSDGQFLYVTNLGKELKPSDKDGDGSVFKLSMEGSIIDAHFAKDSLHAPKGTAIVKNTLYVADVDRLVGFDLASGKKVDEISFAAYKTMFLNDIAVKNDQTLFVSATDVNTVFEVRLGEKPTIRPLTPSGLKSPNGLLFDPSSQRLYVVGLVRGATPEGLVGYLTWDKGEARYAQLIDKKGFYDGIQFLDANTLLVTDWVVLAPNQGVLRKINLRDNTYTDVAIEKISGPADVWVQKENKTLLIPELMGGRVSQWKF